MLINVIAVDDEPLALKLITSLIERTPFLSLQGAFLDPAKALEAVDEDTHVMMLDISMPSLTGIELARLLPGRVKTVFTTAYPEFALESYSVHPADYLLKPLTYARFLQCATRLKDMIEAETPEEAASAQGATESDYMFVKSDYRLVRVDYADILYMKGLKDYVSIYLRGRRSPLIATATMKSMEERLPPSRFCRVHKSYIVALGAIEAVERSRIVIGSEHIPVSDAYREAFFAALK